MVALLRLDHGLLAFELGLPVGSLGNELVQSGREFKQLPIEGRVHRELLGLAPVFLLDEAGQLPVLPCELDFSCLLRLVRPLL